MLIKVLLAISVGFNLFLIVSVWTHHVCLNRALALNERQQSLLWKVLEDTSRYLPLLPRMADLFEFLAKK